jgi:hypothetical protein
MLTITINQEVLEEQIRSLAQIHHKAPDVIVQDALAYQLGRPDVSSCSPVAEEEPPKDTQRSAA